MEIAAIKTAFSDILAKVLLSIPAGFVFDEVYIVERLSSEYPDEYLKFCALYADRKEPMETAAEAMCGAIEAFEGILVEEQNRKDIFPTLYTRHKVWKRI